MAENPMELAAEATWTSTAEGIWISTRALLVFFLATLVVQSAAASHTQSDPGGSPIDSDAFESVENSRDILFHVAAPFSLIFLILKLGLGRALVFTIATDQDRYMSTVSETYSKERKKMQKYATVVSLAITGMLVPTRFFGMVDKVVGIVFGGFIYLLLGVAGLYLAYTFLKALFYN